MRRPVKGVQEPYIYSSSTLVEEFCTGKDVNLEFSAKPILLSS